VFVSAQSDVQQVASDALTR